MFALLFTALLGLVSASIPDQISTGFVQNLKQFSGFLRPLDQIHKRFGAILSLVVSVVEPKLTTLLSFMYNEFFRLSATSASEIIPSFSFLPQWIINNSQTVAHICLVIFFLAIGVVGLFSTIFVLRTIRRQLALGYLFARSQTKPVLVRAVSPVPSIFCTILFVWELLLVAGPGSFLLSTPLLTIFALIAFDEKYILEGPRAMALLLTYLAVYSFMSCSASQGCLFSMCGKRCAVKQQKKTYGMVRPEMPEHPVVADCEPLCCRKSNKKNKQQSRATHM
ncbi:hypothetical protein GEMRC1_001996 [Eukaryota sp. GEM-RC1]